MTQPDPKSYLANPFSASRGAAHDHSSCPTPTRAYALRAAMVVCALAAVAAGTSCHASSTGPSSSNLQITNASPSQLSPSPSPQTVQFQGSGFTSGLSLQVTDPTGAAVDVPTSQIQNLLATSFQVTLALTLNGAYSLIAMEPDGSTSAPFALQVGTATASAPVINSVSPSSASRSTISQLVAISGANFSASPSVLIVDPQGVSTTASPLSVATPTSIQFSMAFSETGSYTLTVRTLSGALSNSVIISVQ